MFKRKIRVFGKSIPLTVIVAAILVFAAAAAWVWNQELRATVNTAPGINVAYYANVECELTANPGGDATISPLSNNPPACRVDNARPGVAFTVYSTVHNRSMTDTVCAGPIDTSQLPDYVTLSTVQSQTIMDPDQYSNQTWEFILGDTIPSDASIELIASIPWAVEYCDE